MEGGGAVIGVYPWYKFWYNDFFFHKYESQNANRSLVFLQGPQGVPGQQGNPGKDVSIWCLINPLYLCTVTGKPRLFTHWLYKRDVENEGISGTYPC